jgi:hypothetical protein
MNIGQIKAKVERKEPLTQEEWDWIPEAWETFAIRPVSRPPVRDVRAEGAFVQIRAQKLSLRDRFWNLIFPYTPLMDPLIGDGWEDRIRSTTWVKFGWADRLRILCTGKVEFSSVIATERQIGAHKTQTVTRAGKHWNEPPMTCFEKQGAQA